MNRRHDAMFDIPVRHLIRKRKFLAAPPATTVSKACALMEARHVGAVTVIEDGRLVGIFTERDAAYRVIAQRRDPQVTVLADVMTPAPVTIASDKPYGCALLLMQKNGVHHLPVVENGEPIGIVSSRNALDPELEEFVSEERRREHLSLVV
jgi:CBS domain-containing protein